MRSLSEIKSEIKEILVEDGLEMAFTDLKKDLPENSKAFSELILLEADLNNLKRRVRQGIISQEDSEVKYNSLRRRLLDFVNSLEENDLEETSNKKSSRQGSLLYQIPGSMQMGVETRCRVRIAYDELTILEGIKLDENTKLKDVRIADVMEVELVDPGETPSFAIRTFNRQEQFIERDEYTEWIFYIKPLQQGQRPLLIRLSVIEKIGDRERVREIVLEETVVISSQPIDEDSELGFKTSGLVVADSALVPVKKQQKLKPLRSLSFALVGLLAFSGITYAASPAFRMKVDWAISTIQDSKEAYLEYAEKYDGKENAQIALEKVEEMEWSEATQDTSITSMEDYLENYPEGSFATIAIEWLLVQDSFVLERESTRNAFKKYLIKTPEGPYADLIRKWLGIKVESTEVLPEPIVEATESPSEAEVVVAPESKVDLLFSSDDLVYVAGGTFWMGCTDEQGNNCFEDEKPKKMVELDGFSIGKYEVTQEQWSAVMGENPSYFAGCEKCPVEQITWYEVQAFIKALNQQTGKQYRLPTEAEWEYTARGGSKGSADNYIYAGSSNLSEVAWWKGNAGGKTHPVGQKAAGQLGVFDMSGNVWEWCAEKYMKTHGDEGSVLPAFHTLRGGSWSGKDKYSRVSNRGRDKSDVRSSNSGFRLAHD